MKGSISSFVTAVSQGFTLPRSIDARPIGIDFGEGGLRAVALVDSTIGAKPVFHRTVDGNFAISTDEGRMRALRELKLLKADSRRRYARAVVPESEAYIFTTRLPREALSDPEAAIPFKIEENVPIDPRGALFSYAFVDDTHHDDRDAQVAVAVVPRDTVERYATLFDEADMTLVGLLTRNQAVARAVVTDSDCASLLLVHVHDGIADISVVHGHAVHYSTTVALDPAQIIDRVRKVLSFWRGRERTHGSEALPEFVTVTGSDGDVASLKAAIMEGVELPARVANVWMNCFSTSDYVPPIERVDSHRYAAAIGCALPNARPC